MKLFSLISLLVSMTELAQAKPVAREAKPPYLFLIGDSTVAVRGGWGDGLLSYMKDTAEGENRAKSGTTTVSWKSNGRWADLLESVETQSADYEPIVTIQFGHNDQKSLSLDEYRANLKSIALDIEEAGGTPVSGLSLYSLFFKLIYSILDHNHIFDSA